MARPTTGLQWLGWADTADTTKVLDRSGVGTLLDLTVTELDLNPEIVAARGNPAADYDLSTQLGRINNTSANDSKVDITGKTCTLEAWVETDAGATDGSDRRFFGATNGNSTNHPQCYILGGRPASGNAKIEIRIFSASTWYSMSIDLGSTTALEGAAHHVAIKMNTALASGRVEFFLDNVSKGTSDTIPQDALIQTLNASAELVFGCAFSDSQRHWKGFIWKGSFYSVALTTTEIGDLFALGKGAEGGGTVHGAAASISATATASGAAVIIAAASASVTGSATTSVAGSLIAASAAQVSASATVSGNAVSILAGDSSISATATISGAGTVIFAAAASVTGAATATATAELVGGLEAQASITATASATGSATVTYSAAASISGSATVSVSGISILSGAASISASATASGSAQGLLSVASQINAAAQMTGAVAAIYGARGLLNGAADALGTAALIAAARASIEASGTIVGSADVLGGTLIPSRHKIIAPIEDRTITAPIEDRTIRAGVDA